MQAEMLVTEPLAPSLDLRSLADLYEATLKVRNACANRLRAINQGRDPDGEDSTIANSPLLDRLNDALVQAQEDMEFKLPEHPAYEWLMGVPGINRTLGCRILGLIPMDNETDFATFSKLRVFAGLCPGRNRLTRGEKASFSTRLKTSLFVAFGNLLKAEAISRGKANAPKRFYAEIYRRWRAIYKDRTEQEWSDLHQHLAAKNKLLDVFVCHLWRVWRERKGWSVRSLYVHEVLRHDLNFLEQDFSSPTLAARRIRAHRRS